MINRKIDFTYYNNLKTGEWCQDAPDKYFFEFYGLQPTHYKIDPDILAKSPNREKFWRCKHYVFTKFTNKGELSKTELADFSDDEIKVIKPIAEQKLADLLALEAQTEADTKRALELAKIINAVNWDDLSDNDLAVIKIKTSHSDWYKSDSGELHTPSEYLTLVPLSVVKEAKELQAIRRKHQNDSTFDFLKTSYYTREVRIADHGIADIDACDDDNWTKVYANYA